MQHAGGPALEYLYLNQKKSFFCHSPDDKTSIQAKKQSRHIVLTDQEKSQIMEATVLEWVMQQCSPLWLFESRRKQKTTSWNWREGNHYMT